MHSVQKVLISIVSIALQRGSSRFTSLFLGNYKSDRRQPGLFFRSGKHQKSPSVIPFDLGHHDGTGTESTHEVEHPAHTPTETHPQDHHDSPKQLDSSHHLPEVGIESTGHGHDWGDDPIAESHGTTHPISHDLPTDKPSIEGSKSPLVNDDHKVEEHKVTEVKHEPEAKIDQKAKIDIWIAPEHHHHHHEHHNHHDHPDQSDKPEQGDQVTTSQVNEGKPSEQVAATNVKKESIDIVVTGAEGTKGGDAKDPIAPPTPPTPSELPVFHTDDLKPVVATPTDHHAEINPTSPPPFEGGQGGSTLIDHHAAIDPTPAAPAPVVVGHADVPTDVHAGEVDPIHHPEIVTDPIISPEKHIDFTSGTFTVGAKGEVGVNYIFDGGKYRGDLAIFSLKDLEKYDINTAQGWHDFVIEVTNRALSNSEQGHVIIADATEGARFSGILSKEPQDWNSGTYKGVQTFNMRPGDTFGVMLVPNGTVQQLHDRPDAGGDIRPLFSMVTANPNEAFHLGQVADVNGKGNTFAMEDIRFDQGSDRDYNDVIFQFNGATSNNIVKMDEMVDPALDWRTSELGTKLMEFIKPPANQPLIGIIDTGTSGNNPNLNYYNIHFGPHSDPVSGDGNPILEPGEGSQHGTFITGVIQSSQPHAADGVSAVVGGNDGTSAGDMQFTTSKLVDPENRLITIDDGAISGKVNPVAGSINEIHGINDQAPLYEIRAVGSGKWAQGLNDFVDAAIESGQPNAIANLSIDLTQINPDGKVTTRYEFTPFERAALENARQHHVLVVVAAGNDGGTMSVLGQASKEFDNIITVGSGDANGRYAYSSFGRGLDLLADGGTPEHPITAASGNGLGTMAGTSIATAKVTGATSVVWAENPDLSYRQVIDILEKTATDLATPGWDKNTGFGLLNAAAAAQLARTTTPESHATPAILIPKTVPRLIGKITLERAVNSNFTGTVDWNKTAVQINGGVNIRLEPSSQSTMLGIETSSNTLEFDGETQGELVNDPNGQGSSSTWYKLANGSGWMSALYVQYLGAIPSPQPPSPIPPSPPVNPPPSPGLPPNTFSRTVQNITLPLRIRNGPGTDASGYIEVGHVNAGDVLTFDDQTQGENVSDSAFGSSDIWYHLADGSGWVSALYMEPATIIPIPSPPAFVVNEPFLSVYQQYPELGNPIEDAQNFSGNVSYQRFENGSIVSSPNGTFALLAPIRQAYLSDGGLEGSLGAPTSKAFIYDNGFQQQNFEHGYIVWNGQQSIIYEDGNGTPVPPPPKNNPTPIDGMSLEAFINWATGQVGIARLDGFDDLRGQCVTLIARYIQEVFLSADQRTVARAFGNGKDTAREVSQMLPDSFENITSSGLPKRGAVISFPEIGIVNGVNFGHVGIVMESRELPGGQRQVRIMDSNGDSQDVNSTVREYYSSWINIPDGTANGYGSNIYWTNPKDNSPVIPPTPSIDIGSGLDTAAKKSIFQAAYKARMTDQGVVGVNPIGNAYYSNNGWIQEFQRGSDRFVLTLEDGSSEAFWLLGDNLKEYDLLLQKGINLGYPRSNENPVENRPDATWQAFAATNGTSRIHYSPNTGSVATWGDIGALYTQLGGANLNSNWLGLPTKHEYISGDTTFADFEGGRIANRDGKTEALKTGEQPSWRKIVIPTGFTKTQYSGNGVEVYQRGGEYVQIVRLDQGARLKFLLGVADSMVSNSYDNQTIEEAWNALDTNRSSLLYGFSSYAPFSVINGQFFGQDNDPLNPLSAFRQNVLGISDGGQGSLIDTLKMDGTIYKSSPDTNVLKRTLAISEDNDAFIFETVDSNSFYKYPNILGGQNYQDATIGKDPRTMLSVLNLDDDDGNEAVLLLTTTSELSPKDAGQILESFGSKRENIIMLDGSGSTKLNIGGTTLLSGDARRVPQFISVLTKI